MHYQHLFHGKSFAILGLARSGLSTLNTLKAAGCTCYAWDDGIKGQEAATAQEHALTPVEQWPWEQLTAVIISPGIPHTYPQPHRAAQMAKDHNIPLWGDVELFTQAYAHNPLFAITGTNGKSTTTALLAHVFDRLNQSFVMGGNIGTPVLSLNPAPEAALLLELSSYQLEIMPSVKPRFAALLNITPDHLERHGSLEGYAKAKARIFAQQDANDTAIIGIDDAHSKAIYNQLKSSGKQRIIPISVQSACLDGIHVFDGKLYDKGNLIADLRETKWLKGTHNHQNIACVYAMASAYGLDSQSIMAAIFSFKGLKHRQQYVTKYQNITMINDSKATNGEATTKALQSYSNILWLMGGQKKDDGIKPCLPMLDPVYKVFAYGQDAAIMIQDLPHNKEFTLFENMDQAFNAACDYAAEHPTKQFTLLLSPAAASFDQFNDFEHRGDYFIHLARNKAD